VNKLKISGEISLSSNTLPKRSSKQQRHLSKHDVFDEVKVKNSRKLVVRWTLSLLANLAAVKQQVNCQFLKKYLLTQEN